MSVGVLVPVLLSVPALQITYTVFAGLAKSSREPALATVRLKVEAKSSRKGVDFVDVAINGPVVTAGLAAGHTAGTLRIAHDLKCVWPCLLPHSSVGCTQLSSLHASCRCGC